MTQDTRKDRRVKIVSLNVRYKSATVDEFIENHAHDVSRGGIYIKTASPFPPGTLLKFEIRLVSDQALIMGVGRVVWKRDTTQGTGDRPAGMGVKFIKVDDPSKSVIDKLVNTRSDAGRAYESEAEATAPPAEAGRPAARAAAGRIGKSTMLGVGSLPQPGAGSSPSTRPPGAPSSPPRPTMTVAMFPKASAEVEHEPKPEQTVMKQAAELLEEALREAGGSMEDVGTNPLFAGTSPAASKETPIDKPVIEAAPQGPPISDAPSSGSEAAVKARAMVAGMAPATPHGNNSTSDAPRTSRESPLAKVSVLDETRRSVRPSGPLRLSSTPPKPPKKGASGTLMLLGVVVAAAVAGAVFRDKLFGSASAPELPATSAEVQAAPPQPSAPSIDSAGAAALAAAAPTATEMPASSASVASSASASAPAPAPSPSVSPPRTPLTPARAVTWRPPVPPAMVSKPPAVVPSQPAPPAAAAPTVTGVAPSTTTTPPPKPNSATPKPSDDNPY
jgi:uncharacterized protein (TIGR02266 family)